MNVIHIKGDVGMKLQKLLLSAISLSLTASAFMSTAMAQDISGTINLATAGDTNMNELQENEIMPLFAEKVSKDLKVNVVGTGAGDAGSKAIYDKLKAQKDSGAETFDIDVAIVHESIMGKLIEDELIKEWIPMADNAKFVNSASAKTALGTDVEGYVAPLFQSQTAIAYNSDEIEKPFESFEDLKSWIEENPNMFGYNGITNGASGTSFMAAYTYWKTDDYETLTKGPVEEENKNKWPDVMKELKGLPVTITNGNNGTLDMLNRGEILAGPVWVDMFQTWKNEGRMGENVKLAIPDPGMPGQAMYIVITSKPANEEAALAYANFMIDPQVQADVIVNKYNWYPGIDSEKVLELASDEAKENLFGTITPEILKERARQLPLADTYLEMQDAYENN